MNQGERNVKTKKKVALPTMYHVYMLNDDYTPMEFVIEMLKALFGKSSSQAEKIMMLIHNSGSGVCGTYTYEIAETKASEVKKAAYQNQHPLRCGLKKA